MQQQKIEFRRERDFGSVLGDSLKFIKQNFKTFFASIVFIVGPFILLMGFGYAYMQTNVISSVFKNPGNPAGIFNTSYFLSIGAMVFGGLLANILLSSVVYNYMILYNEKPIEEKISISEVGKKVIANIGKLTVSAIVLIFTLVIVFGILILIGVGLASILGVAGGVILVLLLIVALLILTPVIAYFIPAVFYVVVRDGSFIFSSMSKVKKYLANNFWWTWLIMVVALISLGILQTIFNLPATILSMMSMFSRVKEIGNATTESSSNILLIVFYTLGMFLTYCTSSISHLISAFNFMSHEEQHEGKGLLSRIDEIK